LSYNYIVNLIYRKIGDRARAGHFPALINAWTLIFRDGNRHFSRFMRVIEFALIFIASFSMSLPCGFSFATRDQLYITFDLIIAIMILMLIEILSCPPLLILSLMRILRSC